MSATAADERVARGAQLLDEKRPGWAEKIDLSILSLADSCRCIIGQLHGCDNESDPYGDGIYSLGLTLVDERLHGFDIDPAPFGGRVMPYADREAAYAELDELWIAEIKRRTGGAA